MTPTPEMPTEALLQMYRHLKPILGMVEHVLMVRGAINCPKCGVRHHPSERHVAAHITAIMSTTFVSG